MPSVLDSIVAAVGQELDRRQQEFPLSEVRRLAEASVSAGPPLDFAAALRGDGVRIIAEVKRASPSRGLLSPNLDPASLARAYAAGGAAAISVLTEATFFGGSLGDLRQVRAAAPNAPLLRKDFLFDAYQVYEARAAGADAILLIVAILDEAGLSRLLRLARDLGMAALVEVHDAAEVGRALDSGADIIGINNRNLHTFEVDMATTGHLRLLLPPEKLVVSESGIRSREDMARLQAWGVHAALIGEALVTAPDPAAKLRELL